MIPYGRQSIDARDIRAVTRVLKSAWLTQGPWVRRFEEAFAKYCGAPYAVALSSGTAGLHLAALAAGFGKGDEVITTPMTFVATANCLLYCGSRPRFIDIDPDTLGLEAEAVERSITAKTRGVIPVHFAGQPAVLDRKRLLSKNKRLVIVEDACHALGAEARNRSGQWTKIGSCAEADIAVFSFHPVKHITTGEGGMITMRNKALYDTLLLLRSHGIEKSAGKFQDRRQKSNPWYYEMTRLGYNYRLSDLQCALGFSQLKKIGGFVARRREAAAFYDRHLSGLKYVQTPAPIPGTRSSYHLYPLRIDFKALKKTRAAVMGELKARGVLTQVHYIPVPAQPFYRQRERYKPQDFPNAEHYYRGALSVPIFPSMGRSALEKVVSSVKKVCGRER